MINAGGVYVDAVRRLDDPEAPSLVSPSQGAHLGARLVRSFRARQRCSVPRTDDGRVLFAIPWHGRVLVGTTDTPVTDAVDRAPPAPRRDRVSARLPRAILQAPARPGDVLSVFAGLRPLLRGQAGEQTARLSREHAVIVSDSGLVTITGGKWTTYRRMAVDAVDYAVRAGGLAHVPSATAALKLHGWREPEQDGIELAGRLRLGRSGGRSHSATSSLSGPGRSIPRCPTCRRSRLGCPPRSGPLRSATCSARRTRALFLDAAQASRRREHRRRDCSHAELGRSPAWQLEQTAAIPEARGGILAAELIDRTNSRSTPSGRSR